MRRKRHQYPSTLFALMPILLSACAPVITPAPIKLSHTLTPASPDNSSPISYSPSKVLGKNDSIKVKTDGANIDWKYRELLPAFGRISIDKPGITLKRDNCTATHIGQGYAITAGHCFTSLGEQQPRVTTDKIQIDWGFYGKNKPLSAKCTEIVYSENSLKRDIAIIKVDSFPSARIPIDFETVYSWRDKITLFSHPGGQALQWSQYCKLADASSYYPNFNDLEKRIAHFCDTESGSSGAALLGTDESGRIRIIGVHNSGGYEEGEFNFGTLTFGFDGVLKELQINLLE